MEILEIVSRISLIIVAVILIVAIEFGEHNDRTRNI